MFSVRSLLWWPLFSLLKGWVASVLLLCNLCRSADCTKSCHISFCNSLIEAKSLPLLISLDNEDKVDHPLTTAVA